jgi:hypothetical protein
MTPANPVATLGAKASGAGFKVQNGNLAAHEINILYPEGHSLAHPASRPCQDPN